jgi:hypothetical protein
MTGPGSTGVEESSHRRLSAALAGVAALVGLGVAFVLSCLLTGTAGAASPPQSLPNTIADTTSSLVVPVASVVPTAPVAPPINHPAMTGVPTPVGTLANSTVASVNSTVTTAGNVVQGAAGPVLASGGITLPTVTLPTLTTPVVGTVPTLGQVLGTTPPVSGLGTSTGLAAAFAPVSILGDRGNLSPPSSSAVVPGGTRPRPSGPGAPTFPTRSPSLPSVPGLPPAGGGGSVLTGPTGHGIPFGSLPPRMLLLLLAGAGLLAVRRETFPRLLMDVRHAPPG